MLGIFSSKPDHPLADPKEFRRIVQELVAREPAAALDEVSAWLESLAAAEDLKAELRLNLILQFDEVAFPHARRLGRDYLTSPRLGRAQEFQLWRGNRHYWAQLAQAYEHCLPRTTGAPAADAAKPAALPSARLLHAYGALIKWDQFRYGPIAGTLWAAAGRAYLAADWARTTQLRLPLYGPGSETTVEAEYLKMLVFSASSVDCLLPIEIEVAERLIAHFLPFFIFTAEARPDNVYWVDCAKPLPPTRLARLPEISPTLRFFSTGKALAAVEDLRSIIQGSGELPPELNLGGQYSPRVVLPVLEHLALYWAPKPPMRSHPRHQVKSRLAVIHGLPAVHRLLTGADDGQDGAESWVADDVSVGGMGTNVPLGSNDWIRIGTLVGMQVEGGSNWLVGLIRRFTRESQAQGLVGIETLSKAPRAIIGDSNGLRAEAILLDPAGEAGATVRVALPSAAWDERYPLIAELDGASLRLQPMDVAERGVDFVLARFTVSA